MIIALIGYSGSGKDTFGDYCVLHSDFKRFAFADHCKEVCKVIFDLSHTQLYTSGKDSIDSRWSKTPRELCQWFASNVRTLRDDYFVQKFKEIYNPNDNYVITDCRFPIEVEFLKTLGARFVRIANPRVKPSDHFTEHLLDDMEVGCTINNNGTIDEYKKAIDDYLGCYKRR